jgi:serine/threonine protein kinase
MERHDSPPADLQGQRTSYQRGRLVGSGGRAHVFVARDADGQELAAKVLRPGVRTLRALNDEVAAHAALWQSSRSAPRWCVPVLDHGVSDDGRPFYLMPLYDGPLGPQLHADAPLLHRLDLLVQAAACVEHLHGLPGPRPRVHGQLKPSDFLLHQRGARWAVLLSDLHLFGLPTPDSRAITAGYAAPERWLATTPPGPDVDVFALACLIYRGCTGDRTPLVASAPTAETTDEFDPTSDTSFPRPADPTTEHELTTIARELADELGAITALAAEELDHLRFRLRISLRELLGREALAGTVDDLLNELAPALGHALSPLPEQRSTSAGELRRALVRAYDRLAAKLGEPAWTPVSASVAPPPPPSEPASTAHALRSAAALLAAAGLAVGALAWQSAQTPAQPPTASAPPTPPPAEPPAQIQAPAAAPAPPAATPAAPPAPASPAPPPSAPPAARAPQAARPTPRATAAPSPAAAPVSLAVRVHVPLEGLTLIDGAAVSGGTALISLSSARPARVVIRHDTTRTSYELRVKPSESGASFMVYRDGKPVIGRTAPDGAALSVHLGLDGVVDLR